MLDYLDLGAVRLSSTSTNDITSVDGLTGLPGIRGSTFDRPEADGVIEPANQYLQARMIVIEGEVWGATVDAAWAAWNIVQQALLGAVQQQALLKFRRANGTLDLQCTVRTVSDTYAKLTGDSIGPFLRYQVTLRAADPYLYSQTSVAATASAPGATTGFPIPMVFPIPFGALVGSGTVQVQANGNAKGWPLITVTGPITNPVIGNQSTGLFLYFDNLSLNTGDSLVIDTNPATRSASVAGSTKLGALRFSDSMWPSMTPAVLETWTFYTNGGVTSGATTMTISWRDTYIS